VLISEPTRVPLQDFLDKLVAQLGREGHTLVVLDERPLRLLLATGSYLTVTLRDKTTGEILEPTIDVTNGMLVDPRRLREKDRAAAAGYTALTPRLRDLLLRHPHLAAFTVAVRRTGGETERFTVDAAQVLALAQAPDVVGLDIAEDVVVPD
jgi:hypothetical protein